MPSVWVPKTERIKHPQQCKGIKGFIASSSQGSCHIQHSGVAQEPWAQIYSRIYQFRTKTGSWQGLTGCRGFLVFTDWPVIISLIGQSYHHSDWPELPSLWLARVTIPRSPGSMTQGLFLAQCTSLSLSWLWWGCNTSQYREGWKWTRSAVSDSLRPRGL